MKMFDEEKIRYILLSIIIILELIIIGVEVKNIECEDRNNVNNEVVPVVENNVKDSEQVETIIKKIKIDVKGAVKKEGVFELA